MARALPRRAKVSVRDRLRLPDGLRAFAQGSYKVSLRWRGGCPCGHQFYMPPAGGENHITGLCPMENKPTALRAMEMHPFSRYAGLPPEGEVCSKLSLCSHKHHKGKHRANLPLRGRRRRRRQKGCISIAPKARFYCFPAAGGSIYSSPRSGDTTILGPKGLVKPENPPANGLSNLRTFFKIPLLLKAKSFIITMIYYCFAICGTGTKEILEV